MSLKIADLFALLKITPDAKSFASADNLLSGVRSALVGLVSIGSVYWAKNQITQVADLGDKLDEMAQKTGVPVETLQEMGYAASFSGVSLDAMGTTLGKLSKTMQGAAKGSKTQASTFKKMGVSVKNVDGSLRPMEDVFMDVADHISKMPDGAEKSALAMDVFGRSGRELIPVLNEGGEGLEKLRQEAKDLGLVMSGDDAEAMAGFNDDVDRLKHSWEGVKLLLAKELIPTLAKLVKQATEWVKANRKIIAQRLAVVFKLIAKALAFVAKSIITIIGVIEDLMTAWEGMKYVIGTLVAVFAAVKIASLAAAIASTIAWAASLWPIALAVVGLGILLLVLQDLWTEFKSGRGIMKDLWNAAKEYLSTTGIGRFLIEVIEVWKTSWLGMMSYFKDSLMFLYEIVKDIVDSISDVIGGVRKLAHGDIRGGAQQLSGGVLKAPKVVGKGVLHSFGLYKTGSEAGQVGYDPHENLKSGRNPWESGNVFDMTNGLGMSGVPTVLRQTPEGSAPRFDAVFNIDAHGADPEKVGREVRSKMDEWFEDKMREIDPGDGVEP